MEAAWCILVMCAHSHQVLLPISPHHHPHHLLMKTSLREQEPGTLQWTYITLTYNNAALNTYQINQVLYQPRFILCQALNVSTLVVNVSITKPSVV